MYEESYQESLFKGLPINNEYPMSLRYLERAHAVYRNALTRYSKVFMFHVTLRFPANYACSSTGVISAFINSFRERVQRDLARRRLYVDRVHPTNIHYVWCREVNAEHREHYHVMVLVNANTYRALGCFGVPECNQLAGMICMSWASALGLRVEDSKGLAHFASSGDVISTQQIPYVTIELKNGLLTDSYGAGFFWLSYLCKLPTKQYGNGARNFGSSYW
ncbi:inovirus Gp2 family protein [Vibrio parahaemolyticus]|nr:inovirus Gp2 family protein [Vibrio parahaemolyticus]